MLTELPVVIGFETPPEAKPVESDIMARNCFLTGNGSFVVKEPLPFWKASADMLKILWVPKGWRPVLWAARFQRSDDTYRCQS